MTRHQQANIQSFCAWRDVVIPLCPFWKFIPRRTSTLQAHYLKIMHWGSRGGCLCHVLSLEGHERLPWEDTK